ncbi:MAG: NifB/NifX family molybdenum-iron cluster-binding protein, partial [Syntrophomonas sp.]|nr:NifB/NifX family molybdenum-iron cluster-binding protein [Syntrophomonas sp.]
TSAAVDGHFGRCSYFALWDEENGSFDIIRNIRPDYSQGAGIGAAQELLRQGVAVLICNRIGPKAFTVFHRAGVKLYYAQEGLNMEMVLKQYRAGELSPIEAANNI